MNKSQDRQMQMVGGNGRNLFRKFAGQNAGNQIGYNTGQIARNQNGYNAVHNVGNQVGKNAIQKLASRVKGNGNVNNSNPIRLRKLLGLKDFKMILRVTTTQALEDFWMNKAEIKTMNIDDLCNNFKIVEQSVNKSIGASSDAQNLAFMTAPSTSSTNDVNTAKPAYEVSTVSPNVNTVSPQDLKQIHEDDLEAIDLKWKLSLLSMRAKRVFQLSQDGHFARECRTPRNKEGQ
ncbi:hypothetical protein Tco_0893527 [Tanacetum coccineum]|uniref:Uncharacterized protein n=1 Tax=Tanacetum coccineum TaxID=301880 RepID=A0ABQ5C924_9ASTR